ncbi:cytochrome c3 family protein [Melioribacteraceae bacterium 4301-Me]|uniref:cytochrome c3 family protein n=1 Tax=Pyranulibacter aquaticus TaxID=3163344 RepID=UPI0035968D94
MKNTIVKFLFIAKLIFVLFLFLSTSPLTAQNFNCLDCHENVIANSVHEKIIGCEDCHTDVKNEEHIDKGAKKVNCSVCHEEYAESMKNDIHRRLKTVKNAPTCTTCHDTHKIISAEKVSDKSKQYCGKCHADMSTTLASTYHVKRTSSNVCFECHEQKDIKPHLSQSVHKNLECADCHNYIAKNLNEHPQNVKVTQKADCYLCHGQIAKEHKESIHGIALSEGIDEAAKCWDCHGSHEILPVNNPKSSVYPVNIASTCAKCHDNPKLVRKYNLPIKNPGIQYENSVHGKLVAEGKIAATCTTCHGVHDIKNRIQPGSKISSFNIPATCSQCHQNIVNDYEQSIHWIRAKQGIREAPVCNDCHTEHSIQAVNIVNKKIEEKKLQEKTCVICHEDPRMTVRFGTEGGVVKSYQDSYHGLAVMRGDKDAAMCVDCHSVHKILPKWNPESTVNERNVTKTCQKCHPKATETFAKSYSHKAITQKAQKIEDIVSTIYFWLIISVIGAMFLHNILIYIHEVRRKKKRLEGEIVIPRFTKNEVIQHFILLTSFILLAITGFALKFQNSWWAELLKSLGLTETIRQNVHRTAAVILISLGLYHILYLIFTPRGREILKSLIPKFSDVIDARDNLLYYLHLKKERPNFDNYDYTEKAEYWALIWGTVVMGTTGLFLWFPTLVGSWAPTWLIRVSEIIHFYEAILATLAIVVWHWFFVIFQPSEYPMSLVWINGKMELHHYRHHHEKHFRRIVLEWKEFLAGVRKENQLSNSTKLFAKTLKENKIEPDEVINKELEKDPALREWLENKLKINDEKVLNK